MAKLAKDPKHSRSQSKRASVDFASELESNHTNTSSSTASTSEATNLTHSTNWRPPVDWRISSFTEKLDPPKTRPQVSSPTKRAASALTADQIVQLNSQPSFARQLFSNLTRSPSKTKAGKPPIPRRISAPVTRSETKIEANGNGYLTLPRLHPTTLEETKMMPSPSSALTPTTPACLTGSPPHDSLDAKSAGSPEPPTPPPKPVVISLGAPAMTIEGDAEHWVNGAIQSKDFAGDTSSEEVARKATMPRLRVKAGTRRPATRASSSTDNSSDCMGFVNNSSSSPQSSPPSSPASKSPNSSSSDRCRAERGSSSSDITTSFAEQQLDDVPTAASTPPSTAEALVASKLSTHGIRRWQCCRCKSQTHWESCVCSYIACGHERCGMCASLECSLVRAK